MAEPRPDSLVLRLGEDAAHQHLRDVPSGALVALGGRVFRVTEGGVAPTGEVLGRVARTFVRQAGALVDLTVAGSDGAGTLTGTPEHPFWVDEEAWLPLGQLDDRMALRTVGGGSAEVARAVLRGERAEVFNLEVDPVHTYFIVVQGSSRGVLVHNASYDDVGAGATEATGPAGRHAGDRAKSTDSFGDVADNLESIDAKRKRGNTAKGEVGSNDENAMIERPNTKSEQRVKNRVRRARGMSVGG